MLQVTAFDEAGDGLHGWVNELVVIIKLKNLVNVVPGSQLVGVEFPTLAFVGKFSPAIIWFSVIFWLQAHRFFLRGYFVDFLLAFLG